VSGVRHIEVGADEDGVRLDKWFKRHYPALAHGRLEKLLRKGQIRVDGGRAKAATRVAAGQVVRVPPLGDAVRRPAPRGKARPRVSAEDAADLRARVLYRDDAVLIIDKPAGLAVQGGSGTTRHLDGMLDALTFDAPERPRLVHRLDKDTSGALVLARSAAAARDLTAAFRSKAARKVYWAVVVGVPKTPAGRIDLALAKQAGRMGERMVPDEKAGQRATTLFRTIEKAGRRAAWLALEPLTGRTHQLRVHCAEALGTPILGDGKYGGAEAFLDGGAVGRKLHLHARAVRIPTPLGGMAEAVAPLPEHMRATWATLGFDEAVETDPFFDWGG
jgi:23S rRNA pseudouridine955/2504/2580 synthase